MVDAESEPLAAYAEYMKKKTAEEEQKKKEEEEKGDGEGENADSEPKNEENADGDAPEEPAAPEEDGKENAEDGGDDKGDKDEEKEEEEDEKKEEEEEEEEDDGNLVMCRPISKIYSIISNFGSLSFCVGFNTDSVRLQTALIHDGMVLLADTLKQLGLDQIQPSSLFCKNDSAWEKGLSISNFMRNVMCFRLEYN